jgi:hypothetical protein
MNAVGAGDKVTVRADALPTLDGDIRAWTRTTGHELVAVDDAAHERRYLIRKTARPPPQPPWAFVISDPRARGAAVPAWIRARGALGGSQVVIYAEARPCGHSAGASRNKRTASSRAG